MIKELMYKWFGLSETCRTCEVLERELERVQREKELLLNQLLSPKAVSIPISVEPEELKPVPSGGRRFMPAIIRQQMIDASDKQTLQLMQKHKKDLKELNEQKTKVEELEKEVLGTEQEDASQIG